MAIKCPRCFRWMRPLDNRGLLPNHIDRKTHELCPRSGDQVAPSGKVAKPPRMGRASSSPRHRLVIARDGYQCAYCPAMHDERGKVVERLTLDHVIPQSQGGADAPWNLVACCAPCNQLRRDTEIVEWLEEIRLMGRDWKRAHRLVMQALRSEGAKTPKRLMQDLLAYPRMNH